MEQIRILDINSDYLVCVKPAGVLSQGSLTTRKNMITLLEEQLGCSVFPVHRMDSETTGLMVYACSSNAAAKLSVQIQKGLFQKEYLTVVRGTIAPEQGICEDLLLHDQRKNKTYVVDRKRKGVRDAKLSYICLAENAEQSLVQVRLFTGRTHQIRVQFSSRGYPLAGDRRYGGDKGNYYLASVRLSFLDTESALRRQFEYIPELPYDFDWNHKLKDMV